MAELHFVLGHRFTLFGLIENVKNSQTHANSGIEFSYVLKTLIETAERNDNKMAQLRRYSKQIQ